MKTYDIVKNFGAVSGEPDSTAKIQAALNAAKTGRGTVVIPKGTWNITDALRIYSNTNLHLDPNAVIKKMFPAKAMLYNGDWQASYPKYNGHGNIVIQGGTWDARGTHFKTAACNIFSIAHSKNLTIKDSTFLDVPGYHAIEINSSKNVKIFNCKFAGFIDTGKRGFSEALQLDGAFRKSVFGQFGAYDKTICKNVVVKNCYFGASQTRGSVAWPNGVGSHSVDSQGKKVLSKQHHTGTKIIGNTFEGMTEWAVRTDAIHNNCRINKNKFVKCNGAIGLGFKTRAPKNSWYLSKNITISNNTFTKNKIGVRALNIFGLTFINNTFDSKIIKIEKCQKVTGQ